MNLRDSMVTFLNFIKYNDHMFKGVNKATREKYNTYPIPMKFHHWII